MLAGLPALTHEQQQQAVEKIQQLMMQGMSSGEAIALVAEELRQANQERVAVRFDDEDDEDDEAE